MKTTYKNLCMILGLFIVSISHADLKEVTLFTSGVGYFESKYQVDGDRLELEIPGDALNDILKSLVVYGGDGASLHYALYEAEEPVARKLDELRISLDEKPGLLNLLSRLRGEEIKVEWGGEEITGKILGTEIRQESVDDDLVAFVEYLTLWVEDTLMRLPLEDLESIHFPNADLRSDIDKALNIYADELIRGVEVLELVLSKPDQNLKVGYVQEAPVWKMSYRLVLDEDRALLIGTAHVDHPKGVDWEDIKLTLVSGQPISFYQDLHTPIYLSRPEVQEDYALAAIPDADGGSFARLGEPEKMALDGVAAMSAPASRMARKSDAAFANDSIVMADSMTLAEEVQASAGATGELFAFEIVDPVTLPTGKSAMIQVLAHEYDVDRFSIFNSSVHPSHPVNACELKSGPFHLMPGPLTVMEEGLYAGDARVGNVAPGVTRSISYSMDFTSKVLVESAPFIEDLEKVIIANGIMTLEQLQKRTTLYEVKNLGDEKRNYRIEHPKTHGWDLVNKEKGIEKTEELYRIPFSVPADEEKMLTVIEERELKREVRLSTLNPGQLMSYLRLSGMPSEASAILKKISMQMNVQTQLKQELKDIQKDRIQITQDQQRLRENMKTVNRNGASYSRWETKLLEQENELESLLEREENLQSQLRTAEAQLRKELEMFRTES